jgi:hypothetical protein
VEVVIIGFNGVAFGAWLWVDHDGFGGMERAWLSVVGGVVCIASTRLTCCDVVLALWIEHGGGMRVVRVAITKTRWRVGGSWMEGKGRKLSRVAQHSRPGYAWGIPRLLRGKYGTFRGRCGGIEASIQVEMEEALVGEREDRNEDEADVKFGDDSRRNRGWSLGEQTKLLK